MLQLFDTATQKTTELAMREPGVVGLYVCGPTVYGPPHVGHGRSVLIYDVLRRYLEFRGVFVQHVSNITDIDDKIINRARSEGRDWHEVAVECEAEWLAAMDRMGVLRPQQQPHATDYVDKMIDLIASLKEKGYAYETSEGVYLRAALVPEYGLLTHQSIDDRRAGARVELDETKDDPIDFALWKRAKPDEPVWHSPWGDGRPGWHTECVVMSLSLLGEGFELHGGGQDLIFPHHENERAQAVADGHLFARHWMHNGLVTVAGEKMSKSLGNFTTLKDLLDHDDARSYRFLVLQAHYRSPLEVNAATIDAAASGLARLDALVRRVSRVDPSLDKGAGVQSAQLRERFIQAMDADLDTPAALAEIFEAIRLANSLVDSGDASAARVISDTVVELLGALGLVVGQGESADEEVNEMIARRDLARAQRDFATADEMRAQLEARGWTVEDTPEGTRIHR
ncbi:MAG TPA: cysteine--tRNA ligase [Acidimicrobiales bacterium]|nr:cysteine--tRNA ligase [Acidimicrobiales bacterium]